MKDMEPAFYRADRRTEFEMESKHAKVPVTLSSGEVVMATPAKPKTPRLFNGVVSYPDPGLRQRARHVEEGAFGTKMVQAEADRMLKESERLKAAGLAHCQIGGALKLVTVPRYRPIGRKAGMSSAAPLKADLWCVANLEILATGPMVRGEEGCLSLAGVVEFADAPSWVEARFQLMDGTVVEERVGGYAARVWAHEWAHLYGELLCDRIKSPWRKIFLRHVAKKLKAAEAQP